MANPFFSCRIPPEVLSEIEAYLERTGKGKADFLIAAYRLVIEQDALSSSVSDANVSKEITAIWAAIEELQGKLAA
jgi:flagellar biosynthesis/type III secretory pathway ATPase